MPDNERVTLYFVTIDGTIEHVEAVATPQTYKVPRLRVTGNGTRLYRDRIAKGVIPGHGYVVAVSDVSPQEAIDRAFARANELVRRARVDLDRQHATLANVTRLRGGLA